MARKNLLKGLMEEAKKPETETDIASDDGAGAPARVNPARPRYSTGAIGAVSQSIADLKARSVAEIDPFDIEAGGLSDRLESDDADHAALMDSIREYGQQVPVLVRPHPDKPDKYQIVYGRRRVLALRDLNQPVKALVRSLDDRDVVVAQGQENSARKDLSFIEKVNFARQMRDLGYKRKVICDTLHVDKTVISRMMTVADVLPVSVIEAIGAAPSVGRDRWLALAALIADTDTSEGEAIALAGGETSDKRFETLFHALTLPQRRQDEMSKPAKKARKSQFRDENGDVFGSMTRSEDKLVLTLPAAEADGFDDWLAENLTEIHRSWRSGGGV